MNYSLITIGSNTLRLTVYDINGTNFKTLFRSKIMAGLAGYVEEDKLNIDGIDVAISGILEFKNVLDALSIDNVKVFATASLRNIKNSNEVLKIIYEATGFPVEIISGKEEAILSYYGAKLELPEVTSGAFTDIGGASTEIITFDENEPLQAISYKIGSLKLYKQCVSKILPNKEAIQAMTEALENEFSTQLDFKFDEQSPLICVGGTARTVMKIARKIYDLSDDCNNLTRQQVEDLYSLLTNNKKKATQLILRISPDRIHTLIPGLSILLYILHLYQSQEIIVSNYGIREGFLCKKVIQSKETITSSHKIEN